MNQFLLNSHASQVCVCVRVCVLCAIVHRRIQSRLRLRLKECSRDREGEKDKPNQTEQHSESAIVTSMGNGSTHTLTHSWHGTAALGICLRECRSWSSSSSGKAQGYCEN